MATVARLKGGASNDAVQVIEADVMGEITVIAADIQEFKFQFTSETTGKNITDMVCEKLRINQPEFFGVKRLRNLKQKPKNDTWAIDKDLLWLSSDLALFNQGCDSSTIIYFRHKFWFSSSENLTCTYTTEVMYRMVWERYIRGSFKGKEDDLTQLSSLRLLTQDVKPSDSMTIDAKALGNLVPKYAHKMLPLQAWRQNISQFHQKREDMSNSQAMRAFLLYMFENIPHVDDHFVMAEYMTRDMFRPLPLILSFNQAGVGMYDARSNQGKLEAFFLYSDLEKCTIKDMETNFSAGGGNATEQKKAHDQKETAMQRSIDNLSLDNASELLKQQLIAGGNYAYQLRLFTQSGNLKDVRLVAFSPMREDHHVVDIFEYYKNAFEQRRRTLQLNEEARQVITVQYIDGSLSKKIQVNSQTTGYEAMQIFSEKIGLMDQTFFQLAVAQDSNYRYLPLTEPVITQGLRGSTRVVIRCRFICKAATDVTDPIARHLYYLQAHENFLKGNIQMSANASFELASLHMASTLGNYDELENKGKYIQALTLDQYLPKTLCTGSKAEGEARKKLVGLHQNLLERTPDSAETKYLRVISESADYGLTFFNAILPRTGDGLSFGIGRHGACLYKVSDMELLGSYRLGFELREWSNASETIKLEVKPSRNADSKIIKIICIDFGDAIGALNFYDRIRRKQKEKKSLQYLGGAYWFSGK